MSKSGSSIDEHVGQIFIDIYIHMIPQQSKNNNPFSFCYEVTFVKGA